MGVTILLADDDRSVRTAITRALGFEGYEVVAAADGQEALDALDALARANRPPDALVLDLSMPRVDGLEVCRRLRSRGDRTPILVLTARHAVTDRVAGLDAGADDYLVKPYALEELLARLRALLRRVGYDEPGQATGSGGNGVLTLADLTLDPASYRVHRAGELVELTRTEFSLLELLLRNAGQVLTRELIFERVWGYHVPTTSNSLDVYIGYLRRKTEAGGRPRLIHTVRGVGYVAREEGAP